MHRLIIILSAMALSAGCAANKATPPAPAQSPDADSAMPRPPAVYRNDKAGPVSERTQTGRYSYVANGADTAQVDPLLVIIDVSLPQSLATVEDAADYLLKRSGYCLMEPGSREVRHLYGLPLPSVHRHLGPMTLREALLALGGQAYELVVDEVYREAGYRVIPIGGAL